MKFVKHLLVLAIVLCAIPSVSKAQVVKGTAVAVGGGSSAIFLQMGQGAAGTLSTPAPTGPCAWTFKAKNNPLAASVVARDTRPAGGNIDEQGDMWIVWTVGTASGSTCASPDATGAGVNVYSGMKLDSVVGDKCYFMVDSAGIAGCTQVLTVPASTAGANALPGVTDTAIPQIILNTINGARYTYANTDIRPEDAQFATYRMFQPCGSIVYRNPFDLEYRLTYGLGYANSATPNVGLQVKSAFSSAVFNVVNFNFSGPDPFNTGFNAPQFQVTPIGAQPIVVVVAPVTDTTGIGGATDVNGHTLSMFYDGVLARSTDFPGVTTTNPVVTLVREPLSGTYNTFEYSIPNTSQFHKSQDDNFCNGSAVFSQTMNIASSTGGVAGAARKRVIGTGEMVSTLNGTSGTTDMLGYAFWSAANFNGDTNVKYLTVNGVDPLLDSYGVSGGTSYTPGLLPQASPASGTPPLTAVSFKNLNLGDYPIWSLVRVVGRPGDAGVANLVSAVHSLDSSQHDFITLTNLKVWKTHFPIYGIVGGQADGATINPATPGDLCTGGAAEVGGDAGGANLLKQVNADFCTDYGNPTGLVNQVN